MSLKDDLKSIIIKSGWTITQVVDELNSINNTNTTVQNFSSKMLRETFKYTEVEQILSILGYEITWTKKDTSFPDYIKESSPEEYVTSSSSKPRQNSIKNKSHIINSEVSTQSLNLSQNILDILNSPTFIEQIESSVHDQMKQLILSNMPAIINSTTEDLIKKAKETQED